MQKRRFFFDLIVLSGLIVSLFSGRTLAQSSRELSELYENQQFLKLRQYYEGDQIHDSNWKRFIEALSEDNADSAMVMFAEVYRTTQDRLLKKHVGERISDYYYAKGYYKTAERLLRDKKFLEQTVSAQPEQETSNTIGYGIQVGAFGNYENALALKNKMLKKNRNVTIVNKNAEGGNLFLVVIGKFSEREVAERELRSLRSNNVGGFIIQY